MTAAPEDGTPREPQGDDAAREEAEVVRQRRLALWRREALSDLLLPDGARRHELDVHEARDAE